MSPLAYLQGKFVPLEEANINIMTHAFNYGTGCFEGIRGYWNEEQEQMYLFRLREHYQRLLTSARILGMSSPHSIDELCELTLELVRRNGHREDCYVRPILYKGSRVVGVRMHDLEDHFAMFTTAFGKYIDASEGCRCCVSSYRRIDDNAIPARAKVTGGYINSALAKTEAQLNGFDEAIMLTHDGHVCEGSGENIFLVIGNTLVTPAPSDNILVGITRASVIQIAREELGIPTIERSIDRSELYGADECFMTGTAAEITPVIEIDRRPIGSGRVGPLTRRLQELFFEVVRGRNRRYAEWLTPAYIPIAADR
ncbi:MAG TPA: branched-chain amino acid transaminase [Chloroflexota bacterium]|jgi:branched-chain amino acid aminotransferase|nr:branched-chain amino acid transaminase [Chloroflexota bacterium]